MIALEREPMAWEEDVRTLEIPVLIVAGDADVATLEHTVSMFRLLGGGVMGDMGTPLPASRLAVMPATSHTAVISQPDLLYSFIEPFLKGETPKGFLRVPSSDGLSVNRAGLLAADASLLAHLAGRCPRSCGRAPRTSFRQLLRRQTLGWQPKRSTFVKSTCCEPVSSQQRRATPAEPRVLRGEAARAPEPL
jgi:hypothetical protein